MSNKKTTNYAIQFEYDGDGIEEPIKYYRKDTVIVAIGELQFDTITPAASVPITRLWNGKNQSFVGFSSLNPLKSLHSLLKGTLFTEMPSMTKLTIAKAIVSDLIASDLGSSDYCFLTNKISKLVPIQDGDS